MYYSSEVWLNEILEVHELTSLQSLENNYEGSQKHDIQVWSECIHEEAHSQTMVLQLIIKSCN